MEEFLAVGGFPLLEGLLTMENYVPGPQTIDAILSQAGNPSSQLLLFPEIFQLLLRTMQSNVDFSLQYLDSVMHSTNQYFTEDNPCLESNLLLAQTSLLPRDAAGSSAASLFVSLTDKQAFLAVLDCYKELAKVGASLPLQELASFLSSLPPDASTCRLLLSCCLLVGSIS